MRRGRTTAKLIFLLEEAPEGGYTARALGQSIFTEADTLDGLRANIRAAVQCHFEEGEAPGIRIQHKDTRRTVEAGRADSAAGHTVSAGEFVRSSACRNGRWGATG